jgi:hypothetical protein
LVVIIDTKAHFFTVGALPDEAIQINLEAYIGIRKTIMARLVEIHDDGAGEGTDEGAMVVTFIICPENRNSKTQTSTRTAEALAS